MQRRVTPAKGHASTSVPACAECGDDIFGSGTSPLVPLRDLNFERVNKTSVEKKSIVSPPQASSDPSAPPSPPFTPSVTLYAREGQAVVCPLLRGRSPTRSVAPKQPRASGVLSLRHFGLARGCRRIWRGEF